MITIDDYLKILSEQTHEDYKYRLDFMKKLIGDEVKTQYRKDLIDAVYPDEPPSDMVAYAGLVTILPFHQAIQFIKENEQVNWLYDRKNAIVLFNMERGSHECFVNCLSEIWYGVDDGDSEAVVRGDVIFLSSVSSNITVGEGYIPNQQERTVFKQFIKKVI